MGPIMCRVVTCTPPWALDPTCTTAVAVDQGTAGHDRPCLENPTGVIELATRVAPTQLRVAGWAVDGETDSPVSVHVYVDGAFVTAANADKPRSDVSGAVPPYGPNHGYDVTVPVARTAGTVCVYAINSGIPGPNPLLGCRAIEHEPLGSVDLVQRVDPTHLRVQGWAIDPDVTTPIQVRVLIDGAVVATALADKPSPTTARCTATT
jgi:hypothetical protein